VWSNCSGGRGESRSNSERQKRKDNAVRWVDCESPCQVLWPSFPLWAFELFTFFRLDPMQWGSEIFLLLTSQWHKRHADFGHNLLFNDIAMRGRGTRVLVFSFPVSRDPLFFVVVVHACNPGPEFSISTVTLGTECTCECFMSWGDVMLTSCTWWWAESERLMQ